MSIPLRCPSCRQMISVIPEWAGQTVACPLCHSHIPLPADLAGTDGAPAAALAPAPSPELPRTQCANCGKSIKFDPALAGKRGVCPKCRGVVDIPLRPATAPHGVSPSPTFAAPGEHPGMGHQPMELDPFSTANPLASPPPRPASGYAPPPSATWQGRANQPQRIVRIQKVGPPATVVVLRVAGVALMVMGIINLAFHLLNIVGFMLMDSASMQREIERGIQQRQLAVDPKSVIAFVYVFSVVLLVATGAFNGLLTFGGYAMLRTQYWGFAVTGAILGLIPCVIFTWPFAAIASVTAIIMFFQKDVRDAFR